MGGIPLIHLPQADWAMRVCSHLLWVRCTKALDAIKAADLLLRDGNFPLVIVDLVLNPPADLSKIPQTSWYRLQRLVESAPTACLVMTRQGMVSSAQLKIVLENSWTLETFEDESAISRLQIRVQRSHLHRQERSNGRSELMFATIYLPNFYLQAAIRHQPELRAQPVALLEEQEKKPVIIQLNEAAEQAGIRKGMTPSQALARYLQVTIKARGAHAGKIDPGNVTSLRVYAQPVCGSYQARHLHHSIY